MDDARCWVTSLQLGTRFRDGCFKWTLEAEQEDQQAGLTPEDVTFREVLAALKSVSEKLDFTTERPDDFGDNWVPTLDFKVGQDFLMERYTHKFYEKHINTSGSCSGSAPWTQTQRSRYWPMIW